MVETKIPETNNACTRHQTSNKWKNRGVPKRSSEDISRKVGRYGEKLALIMYGCRRVISRKICVLNNLIQS